MNVAASQAAKTVYATRTVGGVPQLTTDEESGITGFALVEAPKWDELTSAERDDHIREVVAYLNDPTSVVADPVFVAVVESFR